jgi:hypothetical protein
VRVARVGDRDAPRATPRRRPARLHGAAALGIGVALVGSIAGAGTMAATATGAARPPAAALRPHGRRPFTPATGDWDGTLDGLHASFQLIGYPRGTVYGASTFAVRDLVYQRPATCPPSLTDPTLSTFVAYADAAPPYVLIGGDGRFPFGTRSPYGSITSPTRAQIILGWAVSAPGSRAKCSGQLRFAMAPAQRTPVSDGTWRLTARDGSGGSFTVRGAGRIAYGIPLSSITAQCPNGTTPGSFSGQAALFVDPDGTASERVSGNGAQIAVSLRFDSPSSASGEYVATASGCTPTTLPFSAVRVSAAGA